MAKKLLKAEVDIRMPKEIDLGELQAWFMDNAGEIADVVVAEAKASTAFQDITGKLRRSIKKQKVKEEGEEFYVVKATEPYAHLVEFGHVMKTKSGKTVGHVAARPYLRPAKEKAMGEAMRKFSGK